MSPPTVRLTQHYDAPPREVFRAWSDAANLPRWFAPSPEMKTTVHDFDFRVGGTYRITMQMPDGKNNIVVGKFLETVPDTKISMTWRWEESAMSHGHDDSILTIEFAEKDGGTDLTLTHEKLKDQKEVDSHAQGWQGILLRLEKHLA